jgi:hypothetical protein
MRVTVNGVRLYFDVGHGVFRQGPAQAFGLLGGFLPDAG